MRSTIIVCLAMTLSLLCALGVQSNDLVANIAHYEIKSEGDAFTLLGLKRGAGRKDVYREYRKIALDVHPDKKIANEMAQDAMKNLNFAKDKLLQHIERRERNNKVVMASAVAATVGLSAMALLGVATSKAGNATKTENWEN